MELILEIWQGSGLYQITFGQSAMLVICLGLLYLLSLGMTFDSDLLKGSSFDD